MQNDDYRSYSDPDTDGAADADDMPPDSGRWDDPAPPPGDSDAPRTGERSDRSGNTETQSGQSRSRSGQSDNTARSRKSETSGSKNTNSGSRSRTGSSNPSAGGKKAKKDKIDLKEARSARPVHRVVPYLLAVFAVFLFVCMFLNLIFNRGNICADAPSTHPVGAVGYGICFAFFGLFGGAAFALPFLLTNLAVFWRRYVDRGILIEKSVTSFLFQVLLSTFVHVCCLGVLAPAERAMSAGELFTHGARMEGGGFIGGGLGYLLVSRMNMFGAVLLTVLLLAVTVFFFLGMTPQHVIDRIRTKRALRRADKPLDTEEFDDIPMMDRMKKKHQRAASRRTATAEDDPTAPPPGAVTYPNGRTAHGAMVRHGSNLLQDEDSPVPVMPVLNATDETPADSPLFVPEEIGKELNRETSQPAQPASGQTPPEKKGKAGEPAPVAKETPVPRPTPAPRRTDPQEAAMRKADGAAVDHIFPPQQPDPRNTRRVQKSDQGFELGSIFVSGPDAEIPRERVHVPLPPEVPLPGSAPRTGSAPGNSASAAQAVPPLREKRPVPPESRTPAPDAAENTAPMKTTLRQAAAKGPQDYGLSSEELDERESAALAIDRAIAAKKAEQKRPSHTPVPGDPRPVPKPAERPYTFPPISYLQPGEPITEQTKGELEENAKRIAEKMQTFHIAINEITYSCGPTVTRYEVFPAANVRVRTILGMEKDIALTFGVKDVRMESMEGKSAIGIEVPNKHRSTVYLRNMMEAKEFADNQTPLFCCLGADVAGTPIYFSIPKMPHLLVAGATNSGKSVCINCIIMSILYKMRPDQVRLMMIDPKKVEFAPYQGIPHLMAPIITTPKDAAGALQAAVNEMEARFDRIADVGARNIEGYNKIAATDPGLEPMPLIVIIIDELADLMMVARNEVEDSINRLLAKARAAGIHLIIGTQRPSVDVITGLLKSNLPSRIACTVASQVDSRTILDRAGAEKLLGKGDMLFNPTGAKQPIRVQGAFLSDGEVEKICEFVRATNGTAHYDENFTKLMKEYSAQCGKKGREDADMPDASDGSPHEDSKYAEAVKVAVELRQISTSMLQRKIGVGYSRGAKLLDRMEAEGIVTKQDGSKPRDVLMSSEAYIERFVNGNGSAGNEDGDDE